MFTVGKNVGVPPPLIETFEPPTMTVMENKSLTTRVHTERANVRVPGAAGPGVRPGHRGAGAPGAERRLALKSLRLQMGWTREPRRAYRFS